MTLQVRNNFTEDRQCVLYTGSSKFEFFYLTFGLIVVPRLAYLEQVLSQTKCNVDVERAVPVIQSKKRKIQHMLIL